MGAYGNCCQKFIKILIDGVCLRSPMLRLEGFDFDFVNSDGIFAIDSGFNTPWGLRVNTDLNFMAWRLIHVDLNR